MVSPTGSGSAAIARTSAAMPGQPFRRSARAGRADPSAGPPRHAGLHVAGVGLEDLVRAALQSASAMASSAAFLVSVSRRASPRAARRAAAQTSATDWAVVAIEGKGIGHVPPAPTIAQRRPRKRQPQVARRTRISAHEPGPDADDAQAERERAQCDRHEHPQRREQHPPHEKARVAGADQDAVEREDRAVDGLHEREERPDLLRSLDHPRVARERARQHVDQRRASQRPNNAPAATAHSIILRAAR